MRTRFVLGAVAMTTALAAVPAGTAVAQSAPSAPSAQPRQPTGGPAWPHLVTGVVRDLTGHALGGVCVLAGGADGMARMARTSASGRYVMSLPRAGAYSVRYRYCQPGSATASAVASLSARRIEVGAALVTALPVTTLRLASRTRNQTARNATAAALAAAGIPVPREGRIIRLHAGSGPMARERGSSGPPSAGGLTGRVTGPAGRPIAGICVWAGQSTANEESATGIETARNGTYDFGAGELSPGRYQIVFTSSCAGFTDPFEPLAPGPWAPEWYKGKFARSKASTIVLRAGKVTRGIDAVMRHAGRIGGIVTGSDGRWVKNACAYALARTGVSVGLAVTDSSGAYTITGLDSGSYRVVVSPACLGPSVYGQAWYPRARTSAAARAVATRFGHLTRGINVVVPKLGAISGVIRLGGKTGKPLGGICIDVVSPTGFEGGSAISRRNGAYSVEGVPTGNYQVDADADGCGNNGNYAPGTYPHRVRVINGKVASGIDLFLQPGATLSGTVTAAATGKPLAGICVFDDNFDMAVTSAAGTYRIDQLAAGHTTVAFSGGCGNKGSYAPQLYDNQVAQEAARQLIITAGHVTSGIDAAMLPGATIAGRVTNSAGRPVGGVCVAMEPPDQPGFLIGADTWTNSSGSYVETNLPPGDFDVAFFSGCLGPSNAAVLQWFKGQRTEEAAGMINARAGSEVSGIDAVVSRGAAIAGTVTSTAGHAVNFDCVTAINRLTGQRSGIQSLIGGGFYTISSLAPGSYTVIASACAGDNLAQSVYPRPVTVRAGLTTSKIALRLPPGGAVTGRITTAAGGRPVSGACVRAILVSAAAASLGIGSSTRTGRSGTYKVVGLRTGSYRITLDPNCAGTAVNLRTITLQHLVRVTEGKVTPGVNASLPIGGSIAGQVTGPAAAAEPGACVVASLITGGPVQSASADERGKYLITGLTPGRYKVEFGDPSCSDNAAGLGIQWFGGAADSGAATVITVTAGQTASAIDGALPADGTITGSVTGSSASKLTGVCVSAVPLAKGEQASFTVSAGGSYMVTDLQPGRYKVEFQAGCGQGGVTTQWWHDAGSSAAAKVIAITAGATVGGIDATMTG